MYLSAILFQYFQCLLSSFVSDVYVIKIITWNLADVWHIIFSSDPTNILLWVEIGIGFKI